MDNVEDLLAEGGGYPRSGGTGADVTQDGWPVWKSMLSKMTDECWGRGGGGVFSCSAARSFKSIPHVVRELQFLDKASATGFIFPAT